MAAQPMMAAPAQEVTTAWGMGTINIPVPCLKAYAVPKPQQVPMMQVPAYGYGYAPGMMMPQMAMAPQMPAAAPVQAAPACPAPSNSEVLSALLERLQKDQEAASVPQAPAVSADEQHQMELQRLEEKVNALVEALEGGAE